MELHLLDCELQDRLPFLTDVSGKDSFESVPTHVERNFIFANYGGSQGFDTDGALDATRRAVNKTVHLRGHNADGSSFYRIHDNVMYAADGMKMDYGGHDSDFFSNFVVTNPYDGQNCFE